MKEQPDRGPLGTAGTLWFQAYRRWRVGVASSFRNDKDTFPLRIRSLISLTVNMPLVRSDRHLLIPPDLRQTRATTLLTLAFIFIFQKPGRPRKLLTDPVDSGSELKKEWPLRSSHNQKHQEAPNILRSILEWDAIEEPLYPLLRYSLGLKWKIGVLRPIIVVP